MTWHRTSGRYELPLLSARDSNPISPGSTFSVATPLEDHDPGRWHTTEKEPDDYLHDVTKPDQRCVQVMSFNYTAQITFSQIPTIPLFPKATSGLPGSHQCGDIDIYNSCYNNALYGLSSLDSFLFSKREQQGRIWFRRFKLDRSDTRST